MEYSASDWIVEAKLAPPRPTVSLIHRQELLDQLDQALARRLTLIESPAGYGKTTLLAQWTEFTKEKDIIVGWLNLDEDDADPLQFLAYMVSALASAGANLGVIEHEAVQGFTDVQPKTALANLINALSRVAGPVVLCLDDYHRIHSPEVDSLIDRLLHHQLADFHLIINTRARPQLKIAGLRAQGQLLEIYADQMRFSTAEAQRVFGNRLSKDETSLLVARTEGWAVALQLARLWLEEKHDRAALIEKFSGCISDIAEYLAEQVLADLPRDLQLFLLKTSILEQFDGSLANAVCGRNDCYEMLGRLDRLNCLLVPLDNEKRWFRYHHLFAEYLQDLLVRTHGQLLPGLHIAASKWFESQGLVREAVRHARLAGDLAEVARLIESVGGWELILFGGINTLRNLLRHFPEGELFNYPRVAVSRSFLYLKDGAFDKARGILEKLRAEQDVLSSGVLPPGDMLARDFFIVDTLFGRYQDLIVTRKELDAFLEKSEALSSDDHSGAGFRYNAACWMAFRLGDLAKAVEYATISIKWLRQAGSVIGVNYVFCHLGQSYLYQGMVTEAEAAFRQASDMAEDNFGSDSGLKAISEVSLYSLLYIKGDLDNSQDHPPDHPGDQISKFYEALSQIENYDGWVDVYVSGYITGSSLKFSSEGLSAALALLARGEKIAARRELPRLSQSLQAIRLRFLIRSGALDEALELIQGIETDFKIGGWRSRLDLWRTHHLQGTALAMAYLKFGNRQKALEILNDLGEASRAGGHIIHLIETLALRAIVLDEAGRQEDAFSCLEQAFNFARRENIRQMFLDEGSRMEKLLRQLLRHNSENILFNTIKDFIRDLLARFKTLQNTDKGAEINNLLNRRELEVLMELNQGLSNKQIARKLDMTEHSVKYYLKTIFAKLSVEKRTQAILVARELNLIS